jgi:guanine nucleotide-binding protein subunit beta-2-like 1 protein
MGDQLTLKGVLEGHSGWVTAITTYQGVSSGDQRVNRVLSASRDKTIIVWEITEEEGNFGYALRALKGHNHFVRCCSGSLWRPRTILLLGRHFASVEH